MNGLLETLKPLLDADVGPAKREQYVYHDVHERWTAEGKPVPERLVELAFVGWLMDEVRTSIECTGPVNPVWSAGDPNDPLKILEDTMDFSLLNCLVKAWVTQQERKA